LKKVQVRKDDLSIIAHNNVVYKLNCKNCDASYVRQMRRILKARINEHKNHINWTTTQHSVITVYRLEISHEFDWENIKIFDEQENLHKRLTSEMIFINEQKNGLNIKKDTEYLNLIYSNLFTKN